MSDKPFEIIVWRKARLGTKVVLFAKPTTQNNSEEVLPDLFQEQLFSWVPAQNPFDAIKSMETATKLRTTLHRNFAPTLSPEDRGISVLGNFLRDLRSALSEEDGAGWLDCPLPFSVDLVGPFIEPNTTIFINLQIAFIRQVEWIFETFKNVPGASVTIQ